MAATATASETPQDQSAVVDAGVNPWLIAAAVMLATFMEVLDTAIASVALPYIAGSLSASTDEATWVLTSYLVANAIVLPASNWFSLKFGRKRFLMTCVTIFTIASFACGAAPTLAFMLLARVVQGAGGGALQPLSQAILLESFPPAKRGAAMAVFAFGVVVAPVLGPTLGGWLTDTYSWRYAFYINIPIGVLALFMIGRFIKDPAYISNAKVAPLDRYGLAALVIWTGCLQVILDKGQEDDWFGAVWIRWAALALIVSLTYFLVHCWTHKDTLVDLKVFKDRNFAIGTLLIFMFGVGIYSTVTVLPLFFQELLGYTAFTAGLVVAPRGIGAICGMPIIGYLSNKVDPRWLLTFGFFTFGLTTLYFGNVTLDLSPTTLLAADPHHRIRPLLRLRPHQHRRLRNPPQRSDRQRLRPLQPLPQRRRLHRNLRRPNPPRPPLRRPPEPDRQLRPPHRPTVPELSRQRPASPHQPLRPRQHAPTCPGHTLPAARSPGLSLGLRRRLPLALAPLLLLRRHRLALQKGKTRQTPSRRPLTPTYQLVSSLQLRSESLSLSLPVPFVFLRDLCVTFATFAFFPCPCPCLSSPPPPHPEGVISPPRVPAPRSRK